MKKTRAALVAGVLTVAAVVSTASTAASMPEATKKTAEADVQTPLTVVSPASNIIARWTANTAVRTGINKDDALGAISIVTPGAVAGCRLYVKSQNAPADSSTNTTYQLFRAGGGTPVSAKLVEGDRVVTLGQHYNGDNALAGAKCNTTITVLSNTKQEVLAGSYTGMISFAAYAP